MKIEADPARISRYIMADPFIRSSTDSLIEIIDTNGRSVNRIRLESIIYVRTNFTSVTIGTTGVNTPFSFNFQEASNISPFSDTLVAAIIKQSELPRKIEKDLLQVISDRFDTLKKELQPKDDTLEDVEDNMTLSEKFDALKGEESEESEDELSEASPPMYPVAHTSAVCEGFLLFVLSFLIGLFALSIFHQINH